MADPAKYGVPAKIKLYSDSIQPYSMLSMAREFVNHVSPLILLLLLPLAGVLISIYIRNKND
jgi:hypothetical protein